VDLHGVGGGTCFELLPDQRIGNAVSFTAADEKLARSLFRRGVSLIHVERAILLGAVRKYAAVHENGHRTSISSLLPHQPVSRKSNRSVLDLCRGHSSKPSFGLSQAGADPLWKSEMKCDRRGTKTRDAVGRPSRESSLLGDPSAKFF
jgi:hypothetical protein